MQMFLSPLDQMDPAVLYRVLKLRADAFVVEQRCPFPELDGRDLEPTTLHLWAGHDDRVAATLRVLRESHACGSAASWPTPTIAVPGWPVGSLASLWIPATESTPAAP